MPKSEHGMSGTHHSTIDTSFSVDHVPATFAGTNAAQKGRGSAWLPHFDTTELTTKTRRCNHGQGTRASRTPKQPQQAGWQRIN